MSALVQKAVRSTKCLCCGANVEIYNHASIQISCRYCQSRLIRQDMNWQDLGSSGFFAEDLSPFHLGMQINYKKKSFIIIGRVQQKFAEGMWNEWLCQGASQELFWLSEGAGQFYITKPSTLGIKLPAFEEIQLERQFDLGGIRYSVTNIEQAICNATEGEIPFSIKPQQKGFLVDLMGEENTFASIDYMDEQPVLYVGHIADLGDFKIGNSPLKVVKQIDTKESRCASCGDTIQIRFKETQSVVCQSCRAVNDVYDHQKLVLAYSQQEKILKPKIPMGTSGILQGKQYEVIGFMLRYADGDYWDEYLLYSEVTGFRWLVCSSGHWSLLTPCGSPQARGDVYHKGMHYKHFATYQSQLKGVLGEFYWRVDKGEKSECTDYISPPFVFSREKSKKEINWSEGVYIEPGDIALAFGVELPGKQGIGINQPSPNVWQYMAVAVITIALGLISSWFVHVAQIQKVFLNEITMKGNAGRTSVTSEPFDLHADRGMLRVYANTNLDNDWAEFDYVLINQDTNESRNFYHEVSFYHGYDEGYWSEGSKAGVAELGNVKAGRYVLEVSATADRIYGQDRKVGFYVSHGEASLQNFLAFLVAILILPLLMLIYKYYFEKRRWDMSDHPWETE